ncbi:M20 family metallopeptidase [Flavobacteriales bacterium]|nr:M20 family metallopeptidase [Flavobacteriales bacterium]
MKEKIKQLVADNASEILDIRRYLHANPELSFKEYETSKFVTSQLDKWGVSYKSGFVETGIVAHIEGKNPSSKVIALRGDMDALPIIEANNVPYKSKNEGVMHACGHDVHTSCVMGVAKTLHSLRDEFEGTVKIIFQPGEERLPGGASLMIKEGALENPKASSIVGQHVLPELAVGKVGFRSGMYMASADEVHFTVTGKGGHAALPHYLIDPVLITSHIIVALQQLVSRRTKPGVPCVLSFGSVHANGATNVIPNEVHVQGTFRTMDEEWRKEAHIIMKKMAEEMASSMGATCDFRVDVGYPFVYNDEVVTEFARDVAKDYLGEENVVELDMRMTGEDFSFYTQHMPGCFYRLGVGNVAKGLTSGLHTPTFNVDEKCLEVGTGLMAYIAFQQLHA